MTDLSQYIPTESPIVSAIYAAYKQRGDAEPIRGYLGASIIGHSCSRYLWFTFRTCVKENYPGRIYRLFETGDLEEIRLAKDLRDIGCTVHEVNPETGQQFEVAALGGHFSGHMDGCALGIPTAEKTWHVTEFKTHKDKSFAKLKKEGVQKSKPQHWAQCQCYMRASGMQRALYLAVNKDDDSLYSERIHFDSSEADVLMERAERIIKATDPPERISDRSDWWECRFCDAHDLCHGSGESALPIPAVNCRQCCHATPMMDGIARWACEKHGRSLSMHDQASACDDHLVLPGLIGFAEPTNYGKDLEGNDYIEFTNAGGAKEEWIHGRYRGHYNGACQYTTNELRTLPISALTNPLVESAKELLNAEATGYSADDILTRYPEEDSRIAWEGTIHGVGLAWRKLYPGENLATLTPIATNDGFEYKAAEFEGGRVVIVQTGNVRQGAQIREGVG